MKKTSQLVQEAFYLDEVELEKMARFAKNDYLQKSLNFYRSVKTKPVDQLSDKQLVWLNKLSLMMTERDRKKVNNNIKYQPQKKFTLFPKKTYQGWVWLTYYE